VYHDELAITRKMRDKSNQEADTYGPTRPSYAKREEERRQKNQVQHWYLVAEPIKYLQLLPAVIDEFAGNVYYQMMRLRFYGKEDVAHDRI